jgi:hypothetical protein
MEIFKNNSGKIIASMATQVRSAIKTWHVNRFTDVDTHHSIQNNHMTNFRMHDTTDSSNTDPTDGRYPTDVWSPAQLTPDVRLLAFLPLRP